MHPLQSHLDISQSKLALGSLLGLGTASLDIRLWEAESTAQCALQVRGCVLVSRVDGYSQPVHGTVPCLPELQQEDVSLGIEEWHRKATDQPSFLCSSRSLDVSSSTADSLGVMGREYSIVGLVCDVDGPSERETSRDQGHEPSAQPPLELQARSRMAKHEGCFSPTSPDNPVDRLVQSGEVHPLAFTTTESAGLSNQEKPSTSSGRPRTAGIPPLKRSGTTALMRTRFVPRTV